MKRGFLITLAVFTLIGRGTLYATSNQTVFSIIGEFESCRSNDEEQRNEAERDMIRQAKLRCGTEQKPFQLSPTVFEEACACIHYSRGQLAFANFECR